MDLIPLLEGAAADGTVGYAEFVFVLGLGFTLSLIIGAVYQRTHDGVLYSQDYVHNLVLMGTVVAVVIHAIGDNLAAAFGIFAAFSIIRFRRAVAEARDVGFIFFAMAVGLTVGARQYPFAVLTTLLVSGAVLLVWHLELFAPERPSHMLRVRITNDIEFGSAFDDVFRRLVDRLRLLSVESVQAGMMTELRYSVRLREDVHPSELVDALKKRNGNNRVVLSAVDTTLTRFDEDAG